VQSTHVLPGPLINHCVWCVILPVSTSMLQCKTLPIVQVLPSMGTVSLFPCKTISYPKKMTFQFQPLTLWCAPLGVHRKKSVTCSCTARKVDHRRHSCKEILHISPGAAIVATTWETDGLVVAGMDGMISSKSAVTSSFGTWSANGPTRDRSSRNTMVCFVVLLLSSPNKSITRIHTSKLS